MPTKPRRKSSRNALDDLPLQRLNKGWARVLDSAMAHNVIPETGSPLDQRLTLGDLAKFGINVSPGLGDALAGVDAFEFAKQGRPGMAALAGVSALPLVPALGGMLAGIGAKTANKAAFAVAQDMAAKGISRDEIWKATGWFKGVDGKWKFEIPDNAATYRPGAKFAQLTEAKTSQIDELSHARKLRAIMDDRGVKIGDAKAIFRQEIGREPVVTAGLLARDMSGSELQDLLDKVSAELPARDNWTDRLSSVLGHEEAYNAYPEMRYMDFSVKPNTVMGSAGGQFNGRGMDIGADSAYSMETGRSMSLHELQHAIQQREGFARGGSPEQMAGVLAEKERRLREVTRAGMDPYTAYNRLAGEAEARAVQKRMNLTPDERTARPFWVDYDVPEADQIVRFDDGGPSMFTAYHGSPPAAMLQGDDKLWEMVRPIPGAERPGVRNALSRINMDRQVIAGARAAMEAGEISPNDFRSVEREMEREIGLSRNWLNDWYSSGGGASVQAAPSVQKWSLRGNWDK